MEMIERYLQAVRFWLPKEQRQDIIAELSEDIHAQVEERQAGLGRQLTEAEVGEILKKRGRPLLVANSYWPQDQLIGPPLYPIYLFVLKMAVLFSVVPQVLVRIGIVLFDPSYRAEHALHGWADGAMSIWGNMWTSLFVTAGIVTLLFVILERVQAKSGWMEKWDPCKLPKVRRNPNTIPRTNSAFEVGVNLFVAGWWAVTMWSPIVWNHGEVTITMSPDWPWFFWGFLGLAVLNATLSAANLVRPYWTTGRASWRLVSDVAGAALFCWLLRAHVLVGIAVANASAARNAEITQALNWWMGKCFPYALIVVVVIAAVDVVRIVRASGSQMRAARSAPVIAVIALVLLLSGGVGA